MSTDRSDHTESTDDAHDDETGVPGVGDDERENREQIAETGELNRDALGNADGAS
jgi:hypothetical protein